MNALQCGSTQLYRYSDSSTLMFKTFQGVTEDAKNEVYLRPETAQGIFVNFTNVTSVHQEKKFRFGMCQIGKSFRNEITPGNFTFRTREFEQMELEFFCKPGTDIEWFALLEKILHRLACYRLALQTENIAFARPCTRRAFSLQQTQLQILSICFPFGWGELWGIADRTDFDLTAASVSTAPSQDMTYFDPADRTKNICLMLSSRLSVPTV